MDGLTEEHRKRRTGDEGKSDDRSIDKGNDTNDWMDYLIKEVIDGWIND